jgi:hypothetical protein
MRGEPPDRGHPGSEPLNRVSVIPLKKRVILFPTSFLHIVSFLNPRAFLLISFLIPVKKPCLTQPLTIGQK